MLLTDVHVDTGNATTKFTSRWLLHLWCVYKKHGTILYRKNGDLLVSLSWSLNNKSISDDSVSTNCVVKNKTIPQLCYQKVHAKWTHFFKNKYINSCYSWREVLCGSTPKKTGCLPLVLNFNSETSSKCPVFLGASVWKITSWLNECSKQNCVY